MRAEKLHGISRETLLRYGKPITVVAAELNEFLLGQTVYSGLYVVDKPWMIELFFKSRVPTDLI